MFFEQHSLEPNIGAAYFWLALVKGGRELQQHALEDWMEEGYRSLGVMENHLKHHASSRPTATPSPTSRSMPIPTWRISAITISPPFRRSALARSRGGTAQPCAMDWQPETVAAE